MNPSFALGFYIVGIAGLFYLNRDKSVRTSKSLWLPVLWLASNGSRPVSVWLGTAPMDVPGQLPASSLLDQLFAGALMLSGTIVLRRRKHVTGLLKASWPIMLYFSFCLVSLLWSDFPGWGLKRWVRALGDLIMALIVATDPEPTMALRRLVSRVGFVLLPISVLLIRYYPQMGKQYDIWGERQMLVGVSTNKNQLGVTVFVLTLGVLGQTLSLLGDREQPNRGRRLLAQSTLLAFGINLLFTADSATSLASFALGAGLMLVTSLPLIRRRPAAVHALTLAILLAGGLTVLLGGKDEVVKAMGRNPELTGRTVIWSDLIEMAQNPIGGTGFETFWLAPRVEQFYSIYGGVSRTESAHNGYIETYLNLGFIGVGLIALIIVHGYHKTVTAFRGNSGVGALLVAYVVALVAYSIGEAGFRIMSLSWFFLLLSIVTATRVTRTRRDHPNNSLSQTSWPKGITIPILEMTDQ